MRSRLGVAANVVGNALCTALALFTSVWGWLPHFIGIPYSWFVAGTVMLAVALALIVS